MAKKQLNQLIEIKAIKPNDYNPNEMTKKEFNECKREIDIVEELEKSGFGLKLTQVSEITRDAEILANFCKTEITSPERSNAWKQFTLDSDQIKFKGQLPKELVRNIIYYYTEPRDIVIDPMAGSGTTGAVCKETGRRYKMFDINPRGRSKGWVNRFLNKLEYEKLIEFSLIETSLKTQKRVHTLGSYRKSKTGSYRNIKTRQLGIKIKLLFLDDLDKAKKQKQVNAILEKQVHKKNEKRTP